jgi:adenylate kinase family enzyme
MRRVCVLASASGNGKTTFARALAVRLRVPFHELDALNHGPGWTEATPDELASAVRAIVADDAWVIDGAYRVKLGDLVLASADTVVWLDLALHVWLPRLLARTTRRVVHREELWNGNRETLGKAFSRDSVVLHALRTHRRRRRDYPLQLARFHPVRLRSEAEVDAFLAAAPGVPPASLLP